MRPDFFVLALQSALLRSHFTCQKSLKNHCIPNVILNTHSTTRHVAYCLKFLITLADKMNKMDKTITPQKIVAQNELQITLLKTLVDVMVFHVYKDRWTPKKGEILKAVVEPKNKEHKFAVTVMKDDFLVGHLPKEKTGRFPKIIFYFPRACNRNICSLEITGKARNQGDRKGKRNEGSLQVKFFS